MSNRLTRCGLAGLLWAGCTCTALAQNIADNPDWVEEVVADAPAFSQTALIPIEMPPYVSLKVGVDPATVTVGKDGVVRYVVVMTNTTGSVSAAFEGIRCATQEVKTYARHMSTGRWSQVASPQWKFFTDTMPSRHAYAFARQGACVARSAPNKADILNKLKNGLKD